MRLCQLMFIGEAELAGDLLEIAGILVSRSASGRRLDRSRSSTHPLYANNAVSKRDTMGHLKVSR